MKRWFAALLLLTSITAQADELTLLFIRSPEINWSSPRSLAKSTVTSMSQSYGLGHVNIRIACSHREVFTGIYNRYTNATKDAVTKKGMGLGVLFNLFEGLLQNPKNIVPSFSKLSEDNRTNFLTFKINPATCQRLLDYHDQYAELQNTRHRSVRGRGQNPNHEQQIYYGFPALARLGEGAGCSGFAVSFLEVAGLKEQWMVNEWTQFYRVPETTVGQPLRPISVSLSSMLFGAPKRWATENEKHYPLFFWDPDLMVKSTQKKMASGNFQVVKMYGSSGYILDRTQIPTPHEPIFLNNPETNATNPTTIYRDVNELNRRYEISRRISFESTAPTSSIPD